VLRDGRLGDVELVLDDSRDAARSHFAVGEQLQDAASDRIAQDIERVHSAESKR
jgi:hypothetical protein